MTRLSSRLRAAALAGLLLVATFVTAAAPATTAAAGTPAQSIIATAESHLNAPWVYGATGPYAFDCSGLVYAAFRDTGYFYVIGNGAYRSATAMWWLFASRGLASPIDGQPGDLVVYGGGSHIGIYLGNGLVISTLVNGVKITGLYALTAPFTTFLHTGMAALSVRPTTSLWLRSTPAGYNTVVGSVAGGSFRPALAFAGDAQGHSWEQVRAANGAVGWMPWYLRVAGFGHTRVAVNLRAGPGTGYAVVAYAGAGTSFYSYTSTTDAFGRAWARIRLSTGATGFAMIPYLGL